MLKIFHRKVHNLYRIQNTAIIIEYGIIGEGSQICRDCLRRKGHKSQLLAGEGSVKKVKFVTLPRLYRTPLNYIRSRTYRNALKEAYPVIIEGIPKRRYAQQAEPTDRGALNEIIVDIN